VGRRRDRRPDRAAGCRRASSSRPPSPSSASAEIAAPPDKVYALVADPRSWKQWSAWNRRDPQMLIEYGGPAGRHGREVDLEEQEPGRRRDDLHLPRSRRSGSPSISISPISAPPRKASFASSP
jgi:hypothetical protein